MRFKHLFLQFVSYFFNKFVKVESKVIVLQETFELLVYGNKVATVSKIFLLQFVVSILRDNANLIVKLCLVTNVVQR